MRYLLLCLTLLSACGEVPQDTCFLKHSEEKGFILTCAERDDLELRSLCPKMEDYTDEDFIR